MTQNINTCEEFLCKLAAIYGSLIISARAPISNICEQIVEKGRSEIIKERVTNALADISAHIDFHRGIDRDFIELGDALLINDKKGIDEIIDNMSWEIADYSGLVLLHRRRLNDRAFLSYPFGKFNIRVSYNGRIDKRVLHFNREESYEGIAREIDELDKTRESLIASERVYLSIKGRWPWRKERGKSTLLEESLGITLGELSHAGYLPGNID